MRIRPLAAASALATALTLCASTLPAHAATTGSDVRLSALTAINKLRRDAGVAPVAMTQELNAAAQACADDIASQMGTWNGSGYEPSCRVTPKVPEGGTALMQMGGGSAGSLGPMVSGDYIVSQADRFYPGEEEKTEYTVYGAAVGYGTDANGLRWAVFYSLLGAYPTQPGTSYPTNTVGDSSGDQVADVYAVDRSGNLLFSQGRATGQFTTPQVTGSGYGDASYLAQVPDMTGDQRPDVLVRRSSDASLWLYKGLGMGRLEAARQMGSNWSGMDQIVPVGALAGGSTQYVVARRAGDGVLFRYRLTPSGLSDGTAIGKGWSGMRQILGTGDFNGDGRADVLAIRSDGTLWMYQGTAQGTIGAGRQLGHGWNGFVRAFVPGDMTGDGRYELVGQRSDGALYAYTNMGSSWGPARLVLTGTAGYRLMG